MWVNHQSCPVCRGDKFLRVGELNRLFFLADREDKTQWTMYFLYSVKAGSKTSKGRIDYREMPLEVKRAWEEFSKKFTEYV